MISQKYGKFYKHLNCDEVYFRSQVSRDLKRVFLITQTTPIATSQDILQNCSTEWRDIYNYVLPINNSINGTFYFDTGEIKTNVTRGKYSGKKTNQFDFRPIALIPVNRYGCQSVNRGTDGDSLKKRRQLTQHCTIPPICRGEKNQTMVWLDMFKLSTAASSKDGISKEPLTKWRVSLNRHIFIMI